MQIFSTFEQSQYLELAISLLEQKGIRKENIYAVPLNGRKKNIPLFDTLRRSDGYSVSDIAIALATGFSVIGASIGFTLAWGPIYWGLIAALTGFVIGFLIKTGIIKWTERGSGPKSRSRPAEVILIIQCGPDQAKLVEDTLWEHLALGVAMVRNDETGD
ncbi:hypothetical protein EWI07_13500 [Sporolactobacillus sp. THM7-4]|nr:hypothetical protein EWI07_13500 [Sporolactobacillus sp. THM7-4]